MHIVIIIIIISTASLICFLRDTWMPTLDGFLLLSKYDGHKLCDDIQEHEYMTLHCYWCLVSMPPHASLHLDWICTLKLKDTVESCQSRHYQTVLNCSLFIHALAKWHWLFFSSCNNTSHKWLNQPIRGRMCVSGIFKVMQANRKGCEVQKYVIQLVTTVLWGQFRFVA